MPKIYDRSLSVLIAMLLGEAREDSAAKKNKKEPSIIKTEADRIENYFNLVYQIVSELGFLIPDISHEHDPLRRKYQPSLKYRGTSLIVFPIFMIRSSLECLRDLQRVLSKVYNENFDIFNLIRCRIGEWKFMHNHLLPLLIQLIHTTPIGNNEIYLLLEIINALIFCIDDDDAVKPAYFNDLIHYNCIYKKQLSHQFVIGALTTLLASTMSYTNK